MNSLKEQVNTDFLDLKNNLAEEIEAAKEQYEAAIAKVQENKIL